jgi:hypothetical protein
MNKYPLKIVKVCPSWKTELMDKLEFQLEQMKVFLAVDELNRAPTLYNKLTKHGLN